MINARACFSFSIYKLWMGDKDWYKVPLNPTRTYAMSLSRWEIGETRQIVTVAYLPRSTPDYLAAYRRTATAACLVRITLRVTWLHSTQATAASLADHRGHAIRKLADGAFSRLTGHEPHRT
jgi:hypothetical protein